jgi:hypothetical protein
MWWLSFLYKNNEYNLNNQHVFSAKEFIRQLVTFMLCSEPLGNANITSVW